MNSIHWGVGKTSSITTSIVLVLVLLILQLSDSLFEFIVERVSPYDFIWLVLHGAYTKNSIFSLRRESVSDYSEHDLVNGSI